MLKIGVMIAKANRVIHKLFPFIGEFNVHEVKYFHPSGKSLPNGHSIQRGGFLHECRMNKMAYTLEGSLHPVQGGLEGYRGGVITFATDVNAAQFSKDFIANKVRQLLATDAFYVGNFFRGRYVGDNDKVYDEKSISIEINGLSSKSLLSLAEMICKDFVQKTVLVNDLNTDRIFEAY